MPDSYSLAISEGRTLTLTLGGAQGPAGPQGEAPPVLVLTDPPDNAGMRVTGTLTSDGTTPVTFPDLLYAGVLGSRNAYSNDGTPPVSEDASFCASIAGTLTLFDLVTESQWVSSADVATPDLVPAGAWHTTTNPDAWQPVAPATGTPVVTAFGTAGILGQHAIVNETDVYVCVREEPVKWEKVLIDDGTLTASVINVISSNGMSGLLHLHGDGGYKVTLLAPIEMTADREQFTPDADGALGVLRVYPNSSAANAVVSVGDAWWDNTLNKARVRLS